MATTLSQVIAEVQEAKDTITSFLRQFEVGNLLRKFQAHKIKGFPVLQIFIYLLGCMFSPISTYMSMKIETYKEPFSKDTVYRFCNDTGINWHKFLRLLSERVIRQFIRPATSDKRIEYFVLDDTPFTKTGRIGIALSMLQICMGALKGFEMSGTALYPWRFSERKHPHCTQPKNQCVCES